MTRINLLPWRENLRKERKRQFTSIAIGAMLLMGAVILYIHINIAGSISEQAGRNKFLEDEIAKVDVQIKEIDDLDEKKKELLARMKVIQALQVQRPQIVHVMDELVRTVPEGLYLTKLAQTGDEFLIEGMAQSNARVSAFMRNLDESAWFENPRLDVIQVQEKSGVRASQFTLKVNQVNPNAPKEETADGKGK